MTAPLLSLEKITKTFPGVRALDQVDLEVRSHEVVGLVGENGAGKSTLLKVLAGVYRPDSGIVRIRGEARRLRNPAEAAAAGIGVVYQEQSLVPNVTVAENILLGCEQDAVRGGFYRWAELNRRAQRHLDQLGLPISPTTRTEHLSFAERQMVEVAKALAAEQRTSAAPVIVLDEPTSVLEQDDIDRLFTQIRRLRELAGVVFVSHRLDEVLEVSDRVYVMRDGACVAERSRGECDEAELHRLMVGRSRVEGGYYHPDRQLPATDRVRLELSGAGVRGSFTDVSLSVRSGEVLGLAGVIGSGREEVCRAIFGAQGLTAGSVTVDGAAYRFRSPADAARAGVGYIPSERRTEGVAMGMSVRENMLLADPTGASNGPWVNRARRRSLVRTWMARLAVKAPSENTDVAVLSGGNQQKVALAKWLLSERLGVLVLDHPTRGLDVGAKGEVYGLIRDLCDRGLAIVLIGDTLEELIAMSHRLLVLKDGRIVAELDAATGAKPDQAVIVEQMV